MEKQIFYRRAAWVGAGHATLLVLFLIVPFVGGYFEEESPPIVPIDFVVDTRTLKGPEEEGEGNEEEAEPEPPPPPKPTPPPPKPKPVEKPTLKVVEPTQATNVVVKTSSSKPKVQVSTKKVQRGGRTPNPLTPEEIRSRLGMGAREGTYNSAIPGEEERNFGLVKRAFYQAWSEPSRESVAGRTVVASVRLAAGGVVSDRGLVRRSNIPEFDRSVEAALNAVDRIPGLAVSFVERHPVVTIEFKVE